MVYTYMPNFIWMCLLCHLLVAKNHNFTQILAFRGLLYQAPLGPNLVCYSRPTVYAYVPNFFSIGYSVALCWRKPPIFAVFWTSAFSGVANWRQSQKVEYRCTTTNLPLSNGIKIVSVLQRLHGKIGCIISNIQKRVGQTNRQIKKNSTCLAARQWVKSEPHQTWHGHRGPQARSCTSKNFWQCEAQFRR